MGYFVKQEIFWELVDILAGIKMLLKMTKNNFLTGISKQNKEIYQYAVEQACWISYKKQWYTPSQFIRTLGSYEINKAHLTFSKPKEILELGRKIVANIVRSGKGQEEVLDALQRLNNFTDKFWLYHQPPLKHSE